MVRNMVYSFGAALLLAACGSPGESSGTGGSTGGGGGSTGGTTTSSTSSGGTGGATGGTGGMTGGAAGCDAPAGNVYENASVADVTAGCTPIAPAPGEDGTFTITLFGPFSMPFTLNGFSFGARKGDTIMVTDPWTASVTVIPAGGDPTTIDPNDGAKPYPLTLVSSSPIGAMTSDVYSVTLDAPVQVAACESVVVALRNSEGPPYTGIEMCGMGSAHPETNKWWNLNGTMDTMADLSPQFDRNWMVSLLPAPP